MSKGKISSFRISSNSLNATGLDYFNRISSAGDFERCFQGAQYKSVPRSDIETIFCVFLNTGFMRNGKLHAQRSPLTYIRSNMLSSQSALKTLALLELKQSLTCDI